ncbi:MFS transporter [Rhodococcus aetherivorans]|jgi:AAHS family benzoate transporter-like MFS transporter|uniref:Aromatic acid/H+ symport family MFS transporter n=2 Tax=Rhodococcus TaxID=1827 RepID=A0A059MIX8_9NOCA|nr:MULTISPECIES: aromatic acid/H+ symport family MFS transporter [Rhodococcus]AAK58907.1 benzoate transport protein [Rhodococcus sp. 19070]ETT24948.1 major facilitator superfamily MFS_1 [Rhodococcus rhodochrous ATCC 21198]NCL78440.1 Gentisate transporter [Rhodococcus sp. YH1]AKE91870.1 MFS transporter [Rhodococcus aetherivorans]ANZ23284.1 MFS transporter [Rhodococcus sp. WB1]
MADNTTAWASPRHRRTVIWVVALATLAIIFDGYDLVVYGTILPTLMADPSQIGAISAQQGGALGSYALIGVMVGALFTGAFGDRLGRRKMMLINIVWFSVGMGAAAMATSITSFGILRFFTGIGVGGLVATAGAVVAEFAPPGKRNLFNAIVYSGVPAGGVLASLLAIVLRDTIGWRGLFWIGALPLVILLPLALVKLPESPMWLQARGRTDEAAAVCDKFGLPLPTIAPAPAEKVGFAALATRRYAWGTTLLGLMSFAGLLLTYGLNTWLPKIMADAGYNAKGSLAFLLVLNGGAIIGGLLASRIADGRGPQPVIATTFGLAGLALILLTFGFPLPVLLTAVAIAGVGTIGTQVLIYGFVSNYYETAARGAGVAWCAGFGRLGGIFGPIIGGLLIGAGLSNDVSFYIFAGIAVAGALVTVFVPIRRGAQYVARTPEAAAASPTTVEV